MCMILCNVQKKDHLNLLERRHKVAGSALRHVDIAGERGVGEAREQPAAELYVHIYVIYLLEEPTHPGWPKNIGGESSSVENGKGQTKWNLFPFLGFNF